MAERKPHRSDCACMDCLHEWNRKVAARFIHTRSLSAIPGTNLVAAVHWYRDTQVWKRSDYLKRLKALVAVEMVPHQPLRPDCSARPITSWGC